MSVYACARLLAISPGSQAPRRSRASMCARYFVRRALKPPGVHVCACVRLRWHACVCVRARLSSLSVAPIHNPSGTPRGGVWELSKSSRCFPKSERNPCGRRAAGCRHPNLSPGRSLGLGLGAVSQLSFIIARKLARRMADLVIPSRMSGWVPLLSKGGESPAALRSKTPWAGVARLGEFPPADVRPER